MASALHLDDDAACKDGTQSARQTFSEWANPEPNDDVPLRRFTKGNLKRGARSRRLKTIRATDAKEVGVGNPAEETYRCPNLKLRLSAYISIQPGARVELCGDLSNLKLNFSSTACRDAKPNLSAYGNSRHFHWRVEHRLAQNFYIVDCHRVWILAACPSCYQ